MAFPLAAHTFDFVKVYLSQRDLAAPGSGTWLDSGVIFDGTSDPTNFNEAQSFSAGSFLSTDPYGIMSNVQDNVPNDPNLAFLGDGSPASPQLISFTDKQTSLIDLGYWNVAKGAWRYGGEFYAAVANRGPDFVYRVTIIKSSDGSSPWTVQDGSNGPTGLADADGVFAAIQQIDNYIYVCTPTSSADTALAIYPFNMATGLWETTSVTITPTAFGHWNAFSPVGAGGGDLKWANGLFRFPNGNFMVLYQVSGAVPVAALLTGGLTTGTWTEIDTTAGAYQAMSLMDPSLTLVHLFTYQFNDVSSAVHYSTIDQDGVFTPDIAIIPASALASDGCGHPSIQGGMIFLPRDDFADLDNAVWVGALPSPTTFFKELLPVPAGEEGKTPSCAYMMYPNGYSLTPPVTISIACPVAPLTATVGTLFTSDAPVVTGGVPPLTFTLVSGPIWMSINSTSGVVSGVPTSAGTFTYVIRVTDSLGNTATT